MRMETFWWPLLVPRRVLPFPYAIGNALPQLRIRNVVCWAHYTNCAEKGSSTKDKLISREHGRMSKWNGRTICSWFYILQLANGFQIKVFLKTQIKVGFSQYISIWLPGIVLRLSLCLHSLCALADFAWSGLAWLPTTPATLGRVNMPHSLLCSYGTPHRVPVDIYFIQNETLRQLRRFGPYSP